MLPEHRYYDVVLLDNGTVVEGGVVNFNRSLWVCSSAGPSSTPACCTALIPWNRKVLGQHTSSSTILTDVTY